jgi:hypothetical protein
MNPYEHLRDSLYDSMATLFPDTAIVQAYTNGPEEKTPYITYDITRISKEGQASVSGVGTDNTQQIINQYVAQVRFEFIGKQNDDFEAAAMAAQFEFSLDYPDVQDMFLKNALSIQRQSDITRLPKKRDTDWYMCHAIDLFFGYQVEARQNVGITIDRVVSNGGFTAENDLIGNAFTTK